MEVLRQIMVRSRGAPSRRLLCISVCLGVCLGVCFGASPAPRTVPRPVPRPVPRLYFSSSVSSV